MDRVFRRHKTSEVSVVKSRKKFLADKDGQQRLKHLRILIGNTASHSIIIPLGQLDHAKLHQFFQENFSAIFYTFSDSFYSLECDIKQKSNLKDLHGLLSVFESILLLLPGIIHQRWQYNCILEILEELLDGRNALSVRKEGIRLFLIWFQILGTNATAKCHQVFTSLVPGFGDIILKLQKQGSSRAPVGPTQQVIEACRGGHGKQPSVVQPREPVVLVPPTSESNEGNIDIGLELLEYFLKVLVTEVSKITWIDRLKEHHLLQFWFLFEQLKRTYLPLIFPCLSPAYSVYESTRPKSFESHSVIKNLLRDYPISDTQLSVYQECFVLWITRYINANACHGLDSVTAVDDPTVLGVHSTGQHNSRAGSISVPKSPIDGNPVDPRLDAINPATSDSQQFSFDSETRRDSKPEGMDETRGSLSFQSGQRFAVTAYGLADRIDHRPSTISLHNYPKESSHVSPGEQDKATRPIFLQEIDSSGEWILQPGRSNIVAQLCSPLEDKGHEGDDEAEYPRESVTNNKISTLGRRGLTGSDHSPVFNSDSDSSSPTNNAINMESYQNGVNHAEELRGCLQITIQVMFNNMSKIFLLTCSPAVTTTIDDPQGRKVPCTVDYVRKQIELCKSILLFFRSLAINIDLSTESWTTLLSTLLEVLNLTMVGRLPSDRVDDCWLSNEKLIRFMFQTMNIALLRASLVVPIANSLWDQCLTVYSQLTQWPALIIEWRTAMEILTSTMARLVYGVDLASIPDEKKSRHGKRNPGILPSAQRPGAMVSQNIPIMDGESSHGRLSSCSNNRVRTPNVPSTAAEWSEARADGSNNFEFARLNADPPPIFQADEEDSVSLDLNGALGEDETDTEMRSRNRSKSRITLPRSTAGTPRQDKQGTLVPSTDSNFFSLRRAASEIRTASGFLPHDPTFGVAVTFTRSGHSAAFGPVRSATRTSVSPDNLSVLSIGSVVVDRRSRKISPMQSYESPLQKLNGTFPSSPSPPAAVMPVGLDDDSSSNLSRNENATSSRTSAEETSDHVNHGLNSSPQSNLGDRQCANDRESMILPDSVRPTSRYFHRGDTITADSPHQVLAVDSLKTPTKSRFQPHATAIVTRDTYTPRCVLAGGQARGWTPDSVVVCWRRFLGILGRVNTIKSVSNLERIYAYFSDLTNTLLKIREHQLLGPVSDDCVQPIPDYIVPVDYILPTLFEALQLPNHPGSVKLSAIRTLSDAVIRPTDGKINEEVLSQFYLMLHRLLTAYDEPCLREVIRSCGPRFFGSNLPGIHLLLLDFLRGASFVLDDQSGVKEVPRTQALLMYTSLLCYPYHFGPFESLEPSSPATFKLVTCSDLKTKLLHALTQASRADPNAEVRCLALAALAMHCVVELVHFRADRITRPGQYPSSSTGTFLVDALVVLLGMMRFPDHSVAVVAVEMILMLAEYCDLFLDLMPRFPLLIIRCAVWTLRLFWHTVSSKLPAVDKRLLVSLIVCLVEWTLRLPALLVRTPNFGSHNDGDSSIKSNESTLSLVMSTLYMVVCYPPSGSGNKQIGEETTTSAVSDAYSPFPDPLIDLLSECQIKIELQSFSISKPHLDASSLAMKSYLMADFGHPWSGFQLSGDEAYSGLQSVRLAARVALCQILNYQDHFPLDSQGALLNTFIQEHHDQMTDGTARDTTSRAANEKELTTEILESSNVQIFVINSSVLVSLLSLPASSIDHIGSESRSRSRLDSPEPLTSTSDSTSAPMAEIFSPRPLVQSTSSTQTKPHFPHSAVSGKHLHLCT
ncbi:hypothetical protein FGIG_02766 [Fasciola gigantica]|uniref:Ral GTPase-activating protein subunit alpha/beta N-terminal domain-containing protein n=1 Tax=Fasciola gigantica TaxID=46835 RepID=A0A504Y8M6_FASGI|nr:hypothetical protein FGIG_02766 [Fasciola gigantica]